MLIKSMIFTVTACGLTYILCQASQPKMCYVDLQKILREEAKFLAEQNLSPRDLEDGLLKVKKEVHTAIDTLGKEEGAVIITAPATGIMKDVTGIITSSLRAARIGDEKSCSG